MTNTANSEQKQDEGSSIQSTTSSKVGEELARLEEKIAGIKRRLQEPATPANSGELAAINRANECREALTAANIAAIKGYTEETLQKYVECTNLWPDKPETWYRKGMCLQIMGKHDEAIAAYSQSLRFDPGNPKLHHNIGLCMAEQGKLEEAIKMYDKAINHISANSEFLLSKARALYLQNKHEEAMATYDEAFKRYGAATDLLRNEHYAALLEKAHILEKLGKTGEAIAAYTRAIELNAGNKQPLVDKVELLYNSLMDKGRDLAASKSYADAVAIFDQCIQIKSGDYIAWNNKGAALHKLNRHEEAIKCFDRALDINSEYAHAWHNKGVCLKALGALEDAVKCNDKALIIDPNYASAWETKGKLLLKLNNPGEAIAAYKKAIEHGIPYKDELKNTINVLEEKLYTPAIPPESPTTSPLAEIGAQPIPMVPPRPSQYDSGPPATPSNPDTRKPTMKVRCKCGTMTPIYETSRPIQFTCGNCSRKGVIK